MISMIGLDDVDTGHAGLLLSKGPGGRRTTKTPSFWVKVYDRLEMSTVSSDMVAEHGTRDSSMGFFYDDGTNPHDDWLRDAELDVRGDYHEMLPQRRLGGVERCP